MTLQSATLSPSLSATELVSDPFLAQEVVQWHMRFGRRNMPWQNTLNPYHVWLSEVMLQQTQVATVHGYFVRFVARFPDVAALAQASLDDVFCLWSGLGYYSRAKNLHQCAQYIVQGYDGVFPQTARQLQTLPGIGRSTASAIASLCFGERVAILDGNVRRVLARFIGFDADLAQAANERRLWDLATHQLPAEGEDLPDRMAHYTQGMMDLGATVCHARRPDCAACPLAQRCVACKLGQPDHYPVKTRKIKRGQQSIWLLYAATHDGYVWLRQRPAPGVWAGLYCPAWFDDMHALQSALVEHGSPSLHIEPAFRHVLTHKDLDLHPVRVQLARDVKVTADGAWFEPERWQGLGMPAPIKKMLNV